MTGPAKPGEDVIEMEAMDLDEWERDKHTPSAGDKLNELVKQTATPPPMPPSLPKKTQTIARTVVRPASEPNPFDGPTVRNAGAAIPATGGNVMARTTQAIGTRDVVARTATPAAGSPTGSAPTSTTAPNAAPPPPRPATAAPSPRLSTPPAGTPFARITPTSVPAQQAQPVARHTTSRTPALGVSAKPPDSQLPQRGSLSAVATTTPTRTQTPAVGVGVSTGRAATQPGVTKQPSAEAGAARTQALPSVTRTPEATEKPPGPVATVPSAQAKTATLDSDTEGWSLPDDDMAVPSEPRKVVAPKPKLDAMSAENWSLPDSIVEEPPPPQRPPAATTQSSELDFFDQTTVGNLNDDDLPITIAPPEPAVAAFVESVEPASSPQTATDLVMTAPAPEPVVALARPAHVAQLAPDLFAPPPPRALTPPPNRALTPPPGAAEGGPPDVFESDDTMSPAQQRAIKTSMFAVQRGPSRKTKIVVGVLGAIVLVVVVYLAVGRGDDKAPQVADKEPTREPTKEPIAEPTPEPRTPPAMGSADEPAVDPTEGTGAPAAVPTPPVEPPPTEPPPTEPPPTTTRPPTTGRTPSPTPTTGRTPTGRTPTGQRPRGNVTTTPATAPTATAAPVNDGGETAKAAYNAGNKALYAGDAAGAVTQYQAALASMPRYAAAHRGLGLAYSSLGNKAKAVAAFKAYLAASPGAKDTAKIQERITALSL